ncbi:MAG: hypothetical protein SGILL_000671 [Bacillariaceae sp.]
MEDVTHPLALWRYEKEESFSDWTLLVNGTKYHVHKAALMHPSGIGQCRYFAPLFKSDCYFQEKITGTSVFVLDELAAAAIPKFLDYVYMGTTKVDLATVVGLRYLALYFDCPSFFESKCYKEEREAPVVIENILNIFCDTARLKDDAFHDDLAEHLTRIMSTCTEKKVIGYDEAPWELMEAVVRTLLPKTCPPKTPEQTQKYAMSVICILRASKIAHEQRRSMFQNLFDATKLPEILNGWLAITLHQYEAALTPEGLGDKLSPLALRCLDVLKTHTSFEDLHSRHFLEMAQQTLSCTHPPELLNGPYEVIADLLAANEAKSWQKEEEAVADANANADAEEEEDEESAMDEEDDQ